jgi:hypothetical protein
MAGINSNLKLMFQPADITQHIKVNPSGNLTRTINEHGTIIIGTSLDVEYNNVTITGNPSDNTDVATVEYVKNYIQGLDVKESVKCATIEPIIDLSGLIFIDGILLLQGDRVLVKNHQNNHKNGIYLANTGNWSRSLDFDAPSEVQGAFVFVERGAINAAKGFIQLSNAPTKIGEGPLTFTQFNGAYAFEAGDGLTQFGNTLNVDASLNHVTHMTGLTVIGNSGLTTSVNSDLTVANGKVTHLGGRLDVCGNMVVDGSSNLMSNLTVANGKVTHLGGRLDVCGNMVVDGTSNLMNNVTVANGKVTHLGGRLDVCGNVVVDGTLDISSNLIGLNVNNKGTDAGLLVMRKDASNVLIGWDENEEKFVLGLTNAINSATSEVGIITKGVLLADLSGNAETATNAANSDSVTVDISGELQITTAANTGSINMNRGSYSSKFIIDPDGNLIINIGNNYFRYNLTKASDSYSGVLA